MEMTSRNEFAADPQRVAAMLVNQEFLERVAQATDAQRYEITADGNHTVSSRTFPTPPAAAKFAGSTLTIVEDVHWSPPTNDGSRTGTLELHSPGLPVSMRGTASLRPAGAGTVVSYAGDLKVNVPLLGKKLEREAMPAVLDALQVQQRVGNEWLAEHSA